MENSSNQNSCNIRSCDYCQGRPKKSYISINKSKSNKNHKYSPKAPEKLCKYRECKYSNRILTIIETNRNDYFINLALSKDEATEENTNFNRNITDIEMKDETKEEEKLIINDKYIQGTNAKQLEEKLKHINTKNLTKVKIRGDGSCLYRAILVSLNQDEN